MSQPFVGARLLATLVNPLTVIACSDPSPVSPSPSPVVAGDLSAKPSPASPGVYDLSFNHYRNGVEEEVSSLAVGFQELLLGYVTDSRAVPRRRAA